MRIMIIIFSLTISCSVQAFSNIQPDEPPTPDFHIEPDKIKGELVYTNTIKLGRKLQITGSAYDPDGDPFEITSENSPRGFKLISQNQSFTLIWQPAVSGIHYSYLKLTDTPSEGGTSQSSIYTLAINTQPADFYDIFQKVIADNWLLQSGGDLNDDGICNYRDYSLLTRKLLFPQCVIRRFGQNWLSDSPYADFNQDGLCNFRDFAVLTARQKPCLSILQLINADLDHDFEVDFKDFRIFANAWKTTVSDKNWNPECDLSQPADAKIDWADLTEFAHLWLTNY